MDVYSFLVNWAPNRFFDSDDQGIVPEDISVNSGNRLAETLEVAWIERVNRYRREIKQAYDQVRWGSSSWSEKYPSVTLDLPGGREKVLLNDELDIRLVQLYVLHGWNGILQLEERLKEVQQRTETKSIEPWAVVLPFYLFTRNRLILLIRQALIEIEQKAAQEIVSHLSVTAAAVSTAWRTQFQFEKSPSGGAEGGPGGESESTPIQYGMGNQKLSEELFLLLSQTVAVRTGIEVKQERQEQIEESMRVSRENIGSLVGHPEEDLEAIKKSITEDKIALYNFCKKIHAVAPLALLALPLLKQGFQKPYMETVISETLWPFYEKLDELVQAIDPRYSVIEAKLANIPEDVPESKINIEELFTVGYDLEVVCAKKAISEGSNNAAYLVLLTGETLSRLTDKEVIEAGTLAYIVCKRYTLVMMEQIEQSQELQKAIEKSIAKVTSALSVASSVIPPLRPLSAALSVPALLFVIYSVNHQLSTFDQAINLRLMESNPTDLESVSAIGELIAEREEYAEQVTQTVIREVALIVAGGKWPGFHRALLLRNYYLDVEVLTSE